MYLPRGAFWPEGSLGTQKEDSLWRPGVPSEFTWASKVRREFMVDGRVEWQRPLSWQWSVLERKCREKREREGETSIPRVAWKTNKKALT